MQGVQLLGPAAADVVDAGGVEDAAVGLGVGEREVRSPVPSDPVGVCERADLVDQLSQGSSQASNSSGPVGPGLPMSSWTPSALAVSRPSTISAL